MSTKRLILIMIIGAMGVAAFAAAFVISRLFQAPATVQAAAEPGNPDAAKGPAAPAVPAAASDVPRIEEKHLYDLIKEVRQKMSDCEKREQEIGEQEKRLQIARQLLEKEAQELENLRVQVTTTVTRLKEAQTEMDNSRIAIDREETANLKRVAAVYDRMDASAGSRILEGMCTNNQEADAVKILHYMNERSVAKILAEVADKKLAARLCDQMKKIREQESKVPAAAAAR
jgi:flagellar motility protein MotE (MotC chaperone)